MAVAGRCLTTRSMVMAVLMAPKDPTTRPHITTPSRAKRLLALANKALRRQVSRHMFPHHRPHTATVMLSLVPGPLIQKPTRHSLVVTLTQSPIRHSLIVLALTQSPIRHSLVVLALATRLPVALILTQDPTPDALHSLQPSHLKKAHIIHPQMLGYMLTPRSRRDMVTSGNLTPRVVILRPLLGVLAICAQNMHRPRAKSQYQLVAAVHRLTQTQRSRYPCRTL
jgi:hypothetical protein